MNITKTFVLSNAKDEPDDDAVLHSKTSNMFGFLGAAIKEKVDQKAKEMYKAQVAAEMQNFTKSKLKFLMKQEEEEDVDGDPLNEMVAEDEASR